MIFNKLNLENFNTVYSVSDIHGRLDLLKKCLEKQGLLQGENLNLSSGECFLINGDVFDFFYPKNIQLFTDKGIDINWAFKLIENSGVSIHTRSMICNFLLDLANKNYNLLITTLLQRISYEKIIQETIAAFKVFELITFLNLQKKKYPKQFYTLIGNHDLDFLNGEWEYRSLQKNILNWLLVGEFGLIYKEFKDKEKNLDYIEFESQNTRQIKNQLLKLNKDLYSNLNFINEFYFMAISKKFIYVHGGIPYKTIVNIVNPDEFSKDSPNSYFTCDGLGNNPYNYLCKINNYLLQNGKSGLVVGHNPFLKLAKSGLRVSLKDKDSQKYIFNINKDNTIIKLDCGVKVGSENIQCLVDNK